MRKDEKNNDCMEIITTIIIRLQRVKVILGHSHDRHYIAKTSL